MIKIVKANTLNSADIQKLVNRQAEPPKEVVLTVKKILNGVKKNGHAEVLKYAGKFDGLKGPLRLSQKELVSQALKCEPRIKSAIKQAIKNVRSFHEHQVEKSWTIKQAHGVKLGQIIRPLGRVGVYVPGGKGVYPSTVIMNTVPAQIAGVKDIVVVTPAGGKIDPAVAYAIKQLSINEVYKVGGAQAVAMLAYGTKKVKKVDKIVGPANNYASLAKKEVFGLVDIDMIAGPSEILVMADDSTDPDWAAADMLSQAEHGSGYEAALCITNSVRTAGFIKECLDQQVNLSPKKDLLKKCLKNFGRIFVVRDWEKGCELANLLAPEHLEIMTSNYKELQTKLHNAGAIFAGPYSSEPVGDYFAGPNHVLPTNGTARFFSPLGVYDFYKRSSYIQYSAKALNKNGKKIAALAEAEGFYHHAQAVKKRLS